MAPNGKKSGDKKSGDKKHSSSKGRTLVRWDNDLDIQLLLTVQQACNANAVKIPWERVAATMGPKFTEGAIIQHLSKVRTRRENEGKPNPPSLRRSVPASTSAMTPVSASGGAGRKRRKTVTPKRDDAPPPNDIDGEDDGYDTDESEDPSYSNKPKRAKRTKTPRKRETKTKRRNTTTNGVEFDTDDENTLLCAGAPFLALKGDAESYSGSDGSRAESAEGDVEVEDISQEHAIEQQSMVVSLGVDPAALQNLQDTGNMMPVMPTSALDQHLSPWHQGHFQDHTSYFGHQNPHLGQYGGIPYGYPSPQPLTTFSGGPAYMPHDGYDSSIDPRTITSPGVQFAPQRGGYMADFTHFADTFQQQSVQMPVQQITGQRAGSNELPDQHVLDFMWTRSENGEGNELE
ncbi:uncharacterized protein N7503_011427 [Penicillium pulvis]|uniref:uncharacterized protein n=1 Tax=Penicillium pulvis TaxID=1562058 RepID=UPI002546638A|nr:uncharacterized protein N7503_011427 [Penicillium pulvis]KAJ5786215.1 hypothetical protein N7503_011427 [Penicillium pulvis]